MLPVLSMDASAPLEPAGTARCITRAGSRGWICSRGRCGWPALSTASPTTVASQLAHGDTATGTTGVYVRTAMRTSPRSAPGGMGSAKSNGSSRTARRPSLAVGNGRHRCSIPGTDSSAGLTKIQFGRTDTRMNCMSALFLKGCNSIISAATGSASTQTISSRSPQR